MLGAMIARPVNAQTRGFTLIELLVVLAMAAILLTLAAPSFTGTMARKRLEGASDLLATDIQYARSEAAQRNTAVGIVFGANCYSVYVLGSSAATSCVALGTGASSIKDVTLPAGTSLAFTPTTSGAFVAFDPVRGMATDAGAGTSDLSGVVLLTSSAGNWQIQARVTRVGRVKLCSPNATVTALVTDCT